jgi:hypothetical protein
MVYVEVELMARSYTSQVDIRDTYFSPLYKYGLREVHYNAEMRYADPYWVDYSNNSIMRRPEEHGTFDITIDRKGLEAIMSQLERNESESKRCEYEKWLREQNPSLQAAWEHYQTVLGLVK